MSTAKVDLPVAPPKATHRYVTIPDTDLFDMPHTPIVINGTPYGPGTHYLESELAGTVEERLRVHTRANVRILQPKRDFDAENIVNRGRGSATTSFAQ